MANKPEKEDPLEPLLTPKETSAILKKCQKSVYRMIAAGELPAIRVGNQLRIQPSDLRSYIRRNRS